LRVIREELAAGAGKERRKRRTSTLGEHEDGVDLEGLCERAGIAPARARELEEYGLLEPRVESGQRVYSEADAEVAEACETLARFGIAPRHLRAFRTAADRESGLLEALVAPALRSRNPERRRAGLEDLQALAESAHELSPLLFARRPGKLPPETVTARYLLEYGENALEVAADAIAHGARVVIHDDVLATGGTVEAIAGLVEQLGGHVVGVNFVIELSFLEGRKRLAGYDLYSLITY